MFFFTGVYETVADAEKEARWAFEKQEQPADAF